MEQDLQSISSFNILKPIKYLGDKIQKYLFIPQKYSEPILAVLGIYYGAQGIAKIIISIQDSLLHTL